MLRAGRSHDKDHSARQDGRDRISPQRHGPSQPARPSTRNGEREDNDYYTGKYTLILYWRTRMYAHSLVLIKASLVCG